MKRKFKPLFYFPLLVNAIIVWPLLSQVPTKQDCLGAIPICQKIYVVDRAPSGSGNYPNEINPNNTCILGGEKFSSWYTFTAMQSGKLGFLITPNNPKDDYDWALFNISNASCRDLYMNSSLLVSCNGAGRISGNKNACSGETGAISKGVYTIQGGGCYSFSVNRVTGYSPFNALIPVEKGSTYVLIISNWSKSKHGYTLDFGRYYSDVIEDREAPLIKALKFSEEQKNGTVQLLFDEFLDGNNFSASGVYLFTPTDRTIVDLNQPGVLPVFEDQGTKYTKELYFNVGKTFETHGNGQYTLIIPGNGNWTDKCGNSFQGDTLNFTVKRR